ncbi:uncharacterized protein DNG_07065 [Cephalotrichum gorgonifer]|uniref:cellulase n=1 Tax=Cephalotrichum gorgonifer TaxID=2041049 RepID=A0AAE8SX18_9PEZI|nr:uncharacterized protein DNG_07065 [Cephalotrichum gorgonifer]
MLAKFLATASLFGIAASQTTLAKTFTGWNCCKPGCAAVSNNNILNSRGSVKVCDRDNNPLASDVGRGTSSTCEGANSDSGFLCHDYSPIPVSDELSYGFAIQVGGNINADNPNCCRCYELEWLDRNKKMIVQTVYPGGAAGDVRANDLIILTPGGGLGPVGRACSAQYGSGYNWGNNFGGISSAEGCSQLPERLQGGCYWRYNWAGGDVNGWEIVYRPIECPSRLTDISGCASNP